MQCNVEAFEMLYISLIRLQLVLLPRRDHSAGTGPEQSSGLSIGLIPMSYCLLHAPFAVHIFANMFLLSVPSRYVLSACWAVLCWPLPPPSGPVVAVWFWVHTAVTSVACSLHSLVCPDDIRGSIILSWTLLIGQFQSQLWAHSPPRHCSWLVFCISQIVP